MCKICFGIDIGGTSIKLGLFTSSGQLLEKWEIPTRTTERGKFILEDVAAAIDKKMEDNNIDKKDVLGIGMGVPGPVTEDGTVNECVNLGWGTFNVAKAMEELTGLKAKVNNDANVAALGEQWKGGGEGYDSVVMITLGTGVGGGVILDKKIRSGSQGAAGEIGHIVVNLDEEDTCGCGKKGCLEQFASATGIVKETKRLLASSKKESVLRQINPLTAKDIFDKAKEGDELALLAVDQLAKYLGVAISHVSQIVDPEAYVIGGGVSNAGSFLIDAIKKYYTSYVMNALKIREFKLAKLGNDAGIYGSAKLIIGNMQES